MARLVSTERGASPAEAERPSAQEPLPRAPSAPGEWLTWFRREQELIHADREERRRSHGALERQHRGPHGFLTAIVRGSTVVAVTGDAAGLRFVDTRLLQEDALEVLSVPGRRSGGSSTASE